jgi:hypothetical protein
MIVGMLFAISPASLADSVIDESLQSITRVRIVVITAALSYEPVPELRLDRLSGAVTAELVSALAEHSIENSDSADASLVVTITKMRVPRTDQFIVKSVMRLREPAKLPRLSRADESKADDLVVVTSWETWRWVAATADDASDKIRNSARAMAAEFGEAVTRAQQVTKKVSPGGTPCPD